MTDIDERIVEMKFNNAQFEAGTKTSLNTLDKLKQGLKLDGATQGLSNLQAVADKFHLGGIADGVEAVAGKFTALGAIAFGALATIGSQAVRAGEQLIKSFTIEPLKQGFEEYQTQMKSTQTILANTARYGTKLPEVNKNLNELNTYADKTIYSFSDMTSNLSLFTNSGMRIGKATSVIKGFSNEAAASGTNATDAARAAYQLSQAFNQGTIRLMDWRSLTNVGMGNKNMQEGLLNVAGAMGTLSAHGETASKVQKDFNGSLEKGWLSSDVMSNYLKIMAGDMDKTKMKALGLTDAQIKSFQAQEKMATDAATKVRTFTALIGTVREAIGSGWSATATIVVGDFNEATKLFTGANNVISKIIGNQAKARNKMLQDWKDMGGRDTAIQAITTAFHALENIMRPIAKAFREIFPQTTGTQLVWITMQLNWFAQTCESVTKKIGPDIKRTFAGVFAVLDIGRMILVAAVKMFFDLFSAMGVGGGGVLKITANLGDFLVNLDKALKSGQGISKVFQVLGGVLKIPIVLISSLVGLLGNLFDGFGKIRIGAKGSSDALTPLDAILTGLKSAAYGIGKSFDGMGAKMGPVLKNIGSFLGDLGGKILVGVQHINWDNVLKAMESGLLGVITLLLGKNLLPKKDDGGFLANMFKGMFKGMDGGMLKSVKEMFEGVTGVLKGMQENLKSKTLLNIAIALGILTASMFVLSQIPADKLLSASAAMVTMFTELGVAMKLFGKIGMGSSLKQMTVLGGSMIILAIAVGILAGSVKKLSSLSWDELARGLTGLSVILGGLILFAKSMTGSVQTNLIKTGLAMIPLALGIKIMASAVGDMAGIGWENLAQGLTGLAATLVALALFQKIIESSKGALKNALGLLLLSLALKVLASAIANFINMGGGDVIGALVAMSIALAAIAGALRLFPKNMLVSGIALLAIGKGLVTMAVALKAFAGMTWEEIVKGVGTLAIVLGILVLALDGFQSSLTGAAAIVVVMAAMQLLVPVLQAFGAMDMATIAGALIMLGGSLAIIAVAMIAMTEALPGAAALLLVSAGLALLAPALVALSAIPIGGIAIALLALVATFVVLGVAAVALATVVPVIVLLGAAIFLIGAGVGIAAAGVGLLAIGLVALGAAGTAGIGVLILAITAILNMLPMIADALGKAMISFAQAIGNGAPQLIKSFAAVISAMLDAIGLVIPKIISTATKIISAFLSAIGVLIPKTVTTGLRIINGVLAGIAQNIGGITTNAVKIVVNFINAIAGRLPSIIQAGVNLVLKFVNGLSTAIDKNSTKMGEAGGRLAVAIIEGMAKGVMGGVGQVIAAVTHIGGMALQAIKNILGIHSPSKEFEKVGIFVNEGFIKGLVGTQQNVVDTFQKYKDLIKDLLDSSAADMKTYQDKVDAQNARITKDTDAINKQQALVNSTRTRVNSGEDIDKATVKLSQLTAARVRDRAAIEKAQKASTASYKKDGDAKRAEARIQLRQAKANLASNAQQINDAKTALHKAKSDKKHGTTVAELQKKLNSLTDTRTADRADLQTYNDELKTATDENGKAQAATDAITASLQAQETTLEDLGGQWDQNKKDIEDQTSVVNKAQQQLDDYNNSLQDQYDTLDAINKDTTVDDYFTNLEDQIGKTNEFAQKLADLRGRGLGDDAYKKLLASGTEALPFIDDLLNKGVDGVKDFNTLTTQLATASNSLAQTASTSLYQAGVDAAQGLLDGLTAKKADIEAQMTAIAQSMLNAVTGVLDIHSPSREFAKVGEYTIAGLVKGISDTSSSAETAAANVGNNALNALKDSMTGIAAAVSLNMDTQPTIRPVLDLTSVQRDAGRIGGILGGTGLSVSSSLASAAVASNGYDSNQAAIMAVKDEVAVAPSTNTFVQNNYSPKALNNAETYRQTKNLLSRVQKEG